MAVEAFPTSVCVQLNDKYNTMTAGHVIFQILIYTYYKGARRLYDNWRFTPHFNHRCWSSCWIGSLHLGLHLPLGLAVKTA